MDRRTELALLALAVSAFSAAVAFVGPWVIDDDPLDLGSGMVMTPTGQILVSGAVAARPMRIPDEDEYHGAPATADGAPAGEPIGPRFLELTRAPP